MAARLPDVEEPKTERIELPVVLSGAEARSARRAGAVGVRHRSGHGAGFASGVAAAVDAGRHGRGRGLGSVPDRPDRGVGPPGSFGGARGARGLRRAGGSGARACEGLGDRLVAGGGGVSRPAAADRGGEPACAACGRGRQALGRSGGGLFREPGQRLPVPPQPAASGDARGLARSAAGGAAGAVDALFRPRAGRVGRAAEPEPDRGAERRQRRGARRRRRLGGHPVRKRGADRAPGVSSVRHSARAGGNRRRGAGDLARRNPLRADRRGRRTAGPAGLGARRRAALPGRAGYPRLRRIRATSIGSRRSTASACGRIGRRISSRSARRAARSGSPGRGARGSTATAGPGPTCRSARSARPTSCG